VAWEKFATVFAGDQPWDSRVICDATVIADGDHLRVWFGGGDVPHSAENTHGRIGVATLEIR
jgi:hypothetical protein